MIFNQETSGKSVLAWCKENGIPSSTFYSRRKIVKKLAEASSESAYIQNEVVHFQHFRTIEFVSNPMSTYRMDP